MTTKVTSSSNNARRQKPPAKIARRTAPSSPATVLFRKGVISRTEQADELNAIEECGLRLAHLRTELPQIVQTIDPAAPLVIPRFFLWPHYREVIEDIENLGHQAINSVEASSYLRHITSYQEDLGPDLIPWSYSWDMFLRMHFNSGRNIATMSCPWPTSGGFVLKTQEKSVKEKWATHMFAKDFEEAKVVATNLFAMGHGLEDVVVRPHVLLKKMSEGLPGAIPIAEEYRAFILDGEIIAFGHYWPDNTEHSMDLSCKQFIKEAVSKLSSERSMVDGLRFFVVDIAKTEDGRWLVVELNDGCSAGIPANVTALDFYTALTNKLLASNTK